MIIGYNFASDADALEPHRLDIGKIEKLRLFNGIFDELSIKRGNQFLYDTEREEWKYDHLLLAKFSGSLNAGNVDFQGMTIANIVVKKRKIDDLTGWQRVGITPYDRDKIQTYEFYDKFTESHEEYEYALVPVTSQGIEGDYITDTIWSEFEDVFILDSDKSYKLRYNLEFGTNERVTKNALFEPLGSRYPVVVSNGMTNYEKGSLNALLLSDKSLLELNPKEEVKYRKTLVNFLTNNRPKVLKDGNGNFYVIKVIDNPSISFLNELHGALANVSLNWVEIGDSDEQSLLRNGLIDSGVIV